jgi:hypothetical protein
MTVYIVPSTRAQQLLTRSKEDFMLLRRSLLILLLLAGCGTMGHDINDNPHITPTSKTGVTSDRGRNVYEMIPDPSATAPAPATTTAR